MTMFLSTKRSSRSKPNSLMCSSTQPNRKVLWHMADSWRLQWKGSKETLRLERRSAGINSKHRHLFSIYKSDFTTLSCPMSRFSSVTVKTYRWKMLKAKSYRFRIGWSTDKYFSSRWAAWFKIRVMIAKNWWGSWSVKRLIASTRRT